MVVQRNASSDGNNGGGVGVVTQGRAAADQGGAGHGGGDCAVVEVAKSAQLESTTDNKLPIHCDSGDQVR